MNQDILIDTHLKPNKILSNKIIIILIIAIVIFSCANIFLGTQNIPDNVERLDGSIASTEYIIQSFYITFLLAIPIGSFILSLILSIIPFKGKTYSQKYLPVGLILLLSIQIIFFINFCVEHMWN